MVDREVEATYPNAFEEFVIEVPLTQQDVELCKQVSHIPGPAWWLRGHAATTLSLFGGRATPGRTAIVLVAHVRVVGRRILTLREISRPARA